MKNKFLATIFISFAFVLIATKSAFCAPEPSVELRPKIQLQEITPSNENSLDKAVDEAVQNVEEIPTPKVDDLKVMTPNANEKLKNEVVQHANKELKFTIKKLGAMMLGVLISSIVIFLILMVLNKLNALKIIKLKTQSIENKPLETEETEDNIEAPNSIDEALKVFFDKTK